MPNYHSFSLKTAFETHKDTCAFHSVSLALLTCRVRDAGKRSAKKTKPNINGSSKACVIERDIRLGMSGVFPSTVSV